MCTAEVTTPESINCQSNADCIPVIGICNEIVSINKSFLNKHNEVRSKVKNLVSCQSFIPSETPDYIFTECKKSECLIRKTPTLEERKVEVEIKEEIDKVSELEKKENYQECFEAAIKLRNKYPKSERLEQLFFTCQSNL